MRNRKESNLNLLKPTATKRTLFFLISDTLIFSLSLYLALLFRFNFNIPDEYMHRLYWWMVGINIVKISSLWLSDIYRLNWRFVSINELYKIAKALFLVFIVVYIFNSLLQKIKADYSMPRSTVVIDFFISTLLILMLRALRRVYTEILKPPQANINSKRTLIIGAGFTGERIIRETRRSSYIYRPVAIVDDDDSKQGTLIHGVKVAGKLKDIEQIVKKEKIEAAIIAIATLKHKKTRELYDRLTRCGIKEIKIIPPLDKLPSTQITIKDLKDISIEDILAREVANINEEELKSLITNTRILVTGAGGSIGSEIVRQIFKFSPELVIGYEIDETELHNLSLELKKDTFKPVVGDIKDKEHLREVIFGYKPQVVFHAAAYKHVPMMEYFPEEALKTNILGTLNLVELSAEAGVSKFVNISTDKAIHPKSVMGATKRVAEMICAAYNSKTNTKFCSVRFGNVLGSRGSVIPIFLNQIKKGGPVTVTHPEMKRYFMSISEAVLLVLQAAALCKGGEVFILDMGEPIRIVELAERLIRLEGFEPYEDIDIEFTGIRPGEKLFEELLEKTEKVTKSSHPKIFVAHSNNGMSIEEIKQLIEELHKIKEREKIKEKLLKLANATS